MDKIKLKSGREISIKDVGLDERDDLVDSLAECENIYDSKGELTGIRSMWKTVTKWLRTCLMGDVSDKFLLSLSLDERTEAFTQMQSMFFVGEGKASK